MASFAHRAKISSNSCGITNGEAEIKRFLLFPGFSGPVYIREEGLGDVMVDDEALTVTDNDKPVCDLGEKNESRR